MVYLELSIEVVSMDQYDPTGTRKEVRYSEIHCKRTQYARKYNFARTKPNCNRLRQNSSMTNNKEQILDSGPNNYSRVRGDLVLRSKVVDTCRRWSTVY